ncbi:hypothetical protein DPX16_7575 [Anabarilius grahami]|uniref:Uncharacterized protein n=1 Tax=Anabarilius grahami TaxID=495550 RepID=A0A3N0YQZ7_ANAGA|nr:hypothetical protein DPX16_7575 [Anabarilius grahami]
MRTMGYMPTEMELIELGQNINMNSRSAVVTLDDIIFMNDATSCRLPVNKYLY